MSNAEKFISDCTKNYSNEKRITVGKISKWVKQNWLTPDEARKAVEIAKEEVIDKAIGCIEEIYNHHYIMRYSDSCEPPISELIEWFKNYMKEGGEQ